MYTCSGESTFTSFNIIPNNYELNTHVYKQPANNYY